jgi:hypothetical protein
MGDTQMARRAQVMSEDVCEYILDLSLIIRKVMKNVETY